MPSWLVIDEGVDPARDRPREALCTPGNGSFATRGAAPEAFADDAAHHPGTRAPGRYDRPPSRIAGRTVAPGDRTPWSAAPPVPDEEPA